MPRTQSSHLGAFDSKLIREALISSVLKLNLRQQIENPVMFTVEIGSILTTISFLISFFSATTESSFFIGFISLWLWLTVLFSNFAEALSEGRGKARAASLRLSITSVPARKLTTESFDSPFTEVPSSDLQKSDLVLVKTNEVIPGDGDVVKGVALVNEAAITGESAPVVREFGGDRSAVTGGTMRTIGIKTIMITGDNPLTAATIAAEAGVDDYLAEAKPEDKLTMIKGYQKEGYMVAMTGDGTNDAPALAQADVAVAMNNGTQPAREASNIIDLDSDPTKLLDIVEIGKQILMTRGALTTFSIANDIAKYFAIIPAALVGIYPQLEVLNIMGLATPQSAILSAVIFNAVIIPMLIPLALAGIKFKSMSASKLFAYNLTIFGFGGVIAPFIGIKVIDLILAGLMHI